MDLKCYFTRMIFLTCVRKKITPESCSYLWVKRRRTHSPFNQICKHYVILGSFGSEIYIITTNNNNKKKPFKISRTI